MLAGGFGGAVLELFEKRGLCLPVKRLGVDDRFVEHGSRAQMISFCNLDTDTIINTALAFTGAKAVKGFT